MVWYVQTTDLTVRTNSISANRGALDADAMEQNMF